MKYIFILILSCLLSPANAQLQVSADKRFLQTSDGKPFFWLGDTAWELFHRLNREEAEMYLKNRAEKGFTVIQAVALAVKNLETVRLVRASYFSAKENIAVNMNNF